MRLTRQGIYRDCGQKSLFLDSDSCKLIPVHHAISPKIMIFVRADRAPDKSSYNYELTLTPEEVVTCLFTLPASSMAEAVKHLSKSFDLSQVVPELIKQLAIAAIPTPATADDELDYGELLDDDDDDF